MALLTLAELSKKTLGSYVKKAASDAAGKAADSFRNGYDGKKFSKAADRLHNIRKATDKITKEENDMKLSEITASQSDPKAPVTGSIVTFPRKTKVVTTPPGQDDVKIEKLPSGSNAKEPILGQIIKDDIQPEIDMHPVQSFINSVMDEKPTEAASSFEDALQAVIRNKIEARKEQLQQEYFGVPEPEESEETPADEIDADSQTEVEDESEPEVEVEEEVLEGFATFLEETELEDIEEIIEAFAEEAQLDELSKKTLGSYVKKAAEDTRSRGFYIGRNSATAEFGQGTFRKEAQKKYSQGDRGQRNRVKYIPKAVDKLAKEENDLQELSKKTLRHYAVGAASHLSKMNSDSIMDGERVRDPGASTKEKARSHRRLSYIDKKFPKRAEGLDRANKRLGKGSQVQAKY
jgi:hypothetical protein